MEKLKEKLITEITKWISSHKPQANVHLFKKISQNKDYHKLLNSLIGDTIQEKLYLLLNNLNEIPKCPVCQIKLEFKNFSNPYLTYCSKSCKTKNTHKLGNIKYDSTKFKEIYGKCGIKHSELLEKRKQTSLKKYGTEHPMQSSKIKQLYKDIMMDYYGVTNPMHIDEIKKKVDSTNMKRYGVKRPLQNEVIKKKMYKTYKETIRKRYGVDCVFHVPEILDKAQQNSLTRFHYKHLHFQSTNEKHFIDYCEYLGILNLITNGPYVWYEYEKNKCRYFSDFYLEKLNLVIEIKSEYWYDKQEKRNKAKEDACRKEGFDFVFIVDFNYSEFNKYLSKTKKEKP